MVDARSSRLKRSQPVSPSQKNGEPSARWRNLWFGRRAIQPAEEEPAGVAEPEER
jgi:hypothetical protein